MNKEEFIAKLSARLTGQMSTSAVLDQVRYYESYINGEVAKGCAEEEVVASLGDPLLIAKNIVEAPQEQKPYAEPEENPYADPFAGQFGPQQTPMPSSGNRIAQIFRSPDGSLNWGCISGLIVALLILGGVLYLAGKIFFAYWPIILVFVIIYAIFFKKDK